MKEQIQPLISILEQDPGNEQAIEGLEQFVTSDAADSNREELIEELESGRKQLIHAAQFEAACKIVDLEMVVASGEEARELELLREKARLFDEDLFDQETAIALYKKSLEVGGEHQPTALKIDAMETERQNWRQIVETFKEQAETTTEASLKAHMLYSAAERTYKNNKTDESISTLLHRALETDQTHLKAARLLEKILKDQESWKALVELYVSLAEYRRSKEERAQILLTAAQVCLRRLEDRDAAAAYYAEVLDLSPSNQAAMLFLVAYYEEKEEWDHLAAVYEDALAGQHAPEEQVAMLMQAGMIHWRMRENPIAAEDYFKKLRRIEPAHEGMISFYRTQAEETGDSKQLLQVLSDAQRATEDTALTDQWTKEIAQLAAEDGGNVERAIDAWKSVLRKEPDHAEAKSELKRLYREGEKWNALLDLLKSDAESLPTGQVQEKVTIYEEIVKIYRDYLSLGTLVINTYKTILSLDLENESARAALSETYHREGRWNDLIALLTQRASTTQNADEKVDFLLQVANLWIERFNNFNRAVGPLEEVLDIDPKNEGAIDILRSVYQKRRAWLPLLGLMEKEISFLEGEAKRDRLREMAQLAADRLSDYAHAIQLWRQALEIDPETPEALATLEKLTERSKDWEGLCEVLEMRVDRVEADDQRIAILTKMGVVYKDRLKDPARSASAWKRLLEIQPDHAKSMRSLKEAYLAAQEWEALENLYTGVDDYEGLVEVFGIAADRIADVEVKKELSFRCADIYDDPIKQPDRALRHYERILSVEADNERASRALVDIYRRGEKWNRLINTLEIVLGHTDNKDERVAVMDELRQICATKMNNRSLAFEWAAKAFSEKPLDVSVREVLEEAAELADKFSELVATLRGHLLEFGEDDRIELKRHIAMLSLERLGAVEDAVSDYRSILEDNPSDEGALMALEEIYQKNARWEDLTKIFEQRISLSDDDIEKRDLILEMAHLYEDGMDRPEMAEERFRAVLELFPEDIEALSALERLVRVEERWGALAEILHLRRDVGVIEEETWRDISFQLAVLFNDQLDNTEEAIARYCELLDRYPGDGETIAAMEQFLRDDVVQSKVAKILLPHLVQSENWRRLAWVLAILVEDAADEIERLELQTQLAEVYGEKLGDKRVAFDTLGAALKAHPDNTMLWDQMTEIAGAFDMLSDLAERLQMAYQSGKLDEISELELALRLAELFEAQLSRPEDAVVYHRKVFEKDPNAEGTFLALETWYTAQDKWDDLLELYRSALDNNVYVYAPVELQTKICFILEEIKQDVQGAIGAYRAVLDMEPENTQAIRALVKLYEDAGQWQDLSSMLLAQRDDAEGEEATALTFRLGEIAEQHIGLPEDALDYYEQVLTDDPDHLKSQEALDRLLEVRELRLRVARALERAYELQGAAEPMTRILMIELEESDLDVHERVDILTRVADLRERRLSDPGGAFAALAMAFTAYPDNAEVHDELARVAKENGLNARYANVLDEIVPAAMEEDAMLAAGLLFEVARLYDEDLADFERAE
ncbi:MAG: hypothetical protein GY762_07130, partial [Proteobacteria bacterium]|nr:hypothetical protein [Pseudomonadota bacterium]